MKSDHKQAPYDPAKIEAKWQKKWAASKVYTSKVYKSADGAKKGKYYVLDMFPYPSGEGLHVGHPKGYIATDIVSRMKRMQGKNVLHPMGFDAFGLPAENYALKTKTNPAVAVAKNVARYKKQLEILGFDYDWSREVNTTDPAYYKWTQWIFLQMLKKGLAHESYEPVNWCPKDKTVLANEDIENGRCERCGTPVEKKLMKQWVLKITDYADRLLKDLDVKVLPNGDYYGTEANGDPYVIHMNEAGPGKVRVDKPFVEREAISAFVEHWSEDTFIVLKWKKVDWMTPITGGIEAGQTAEEAARAEIFQETGFKDLELVKKADRRMHSTFFHVPKDENRIGHFTCFHFKLKSPERREVAESEKAIHEITWVQRSKMRETITAQAQKVAWALVMDEKVGEGARPLLDWPESIKEAQRNWIGRSEGAEIDFRLTMTKNKTRFILIHGNKGSTKKDFFPWLKNELEKRGHEVEAPELPSADDPNETDQVAHILNNCHFDEDTVVIAHSLGSVVAIKMLMKLNKPISGLVLVAPAIDPSFSPDVRPKPYHKTFHWNFDFKNIQRLTNGKIAILSDTREEQRMQYLRRLNGQLSARLIEVESVEKHFKADKEPEILKSVTPAVSVFTTRSDTLFGVTYVVLSPEHPWVSELLGRLENRSEVEAYIAAAGRRSEIERTDATREKTGVELKGVKAVNPANGQEVPIWIADYVLADYGTGAVMAVPAHDERDFAFAQKFSLPIKDAVAPLYTRSGDEDAWRSDEPEVKRPVVVCLVRHWSEDKYLFLKKKIVDKATVAVAGGIDGEDIIKAGQREIREESGYLNARYIRSLGSPFYYRFYSVPGKQNRISDLHPLYFQLENGDREEISADEKAQHESVWLGEEQIDEYLSGGRPFNKVFWDRLKDKKSPYTGKGVLVDSGAFTGRESDAVMKEITESVGGAWVTTYKLRDWVFSRQRYWGEPIPVVHCGVHGVVPVPEKDLPVVLPKVKSYEPTGTGESPLAAISTWVNVKCPKCLDEKKKKKYFIFDFDGVLGDTWKASIMAAVAMKNGKVTEEEIIKIQRNYFSNKPHHTRDSVRTPEQVAEDTEWTAKFGEEIVKKEFGLFAGFIKEVRTYANVRCAVVSSGSATYIKPALKKAGIRFSHILTFEDHHSKEEKIERIAADWNVDIKDVYYFTDTKADVYELENLLDREKIIGCAWGYQGYEGLAELLPPRQILKDFKDMHRLFNSECAARRETNTMPQWAGSCWYYLRYMDPANKAKLVDPKKEKYWSPVDLYVGGAEHATRHLIYARFWHKFLYDIGAVSTIEPFMKLQSVGLIMGEDGRKMSKRFGNVVNPDDIVKTYGADTMRIYEMFMGPFDQAIPWSTESIVGSRRFIERVWRLAERVAGTRSTASVDRTLNKAVQKVSADIDTMRFNTAISALMIAVNELEKETLISRPAYETLLKLLAPFAPHVTEELWRALGNKASIHVSPWPLVDTALARDAEVKIMVQVGGKVRGSFEIAAGAGNAQLEAAAKDLPEVKKWLANREIAKIIIVPNRLVNIVLTD